MNSEISIRRATPRDAETIIAFNTAMAWETEKLALSADLITSGVRAVLEDEGKGFYFVAKVAGKIAGQMMITFEWSDWRNGMIWWIQSVYVAPEFRRLGVFKAIYQHVREASIQRGVVALRLYVERENENARKTYQSLGMHLSHYLLMEEFLPKRR